MLISYDRKFIFIHIYKNAGTSIEKALEKYGHDPPMIGKVLRKLNIKIPLPNPKWIAFRYHAKAKEIKKLLPNKIYEDFFKFSFVRNPWDWQVSLYHYALEDTKHPQHKFTRSLQSFEEYIEWRVKKDKALQKDFVTDEDGRLIVDFVGRFENIEEDFAHICKELSINTSLPHLKKSSHRDYKFYYNERTKKMIEDHLKEDIEFLEYTFDNS